MSYMRCPPCSVLRCSLSYTWFEQAFYDSALYQSTCSHTYWGGDSPRSTRSSSCRSIDSIANYLFPSVYHVDPDSETCAGGMVFTMTDAQVHGMSGPPEETWPCRIAPVVPA